MLVITDNERLALKLFQKQQGRQWRARLRDLYAHGTRPAAHWWGTDTKAETLKGMIDRLGGAQHIKRLPLV